MKSPVQKALGEPGIPAYYRKALLFACLIPILSQAVVLILPVFELYGVGATIISIVSSLLLILFARLPIMILIHHAGEVFTGKFLRQFILVGAWLVYSGLVTLFLALYRDPPTHVALILIPFGLLGSGWGIVSGYLILLNVAGFILCVGRRLPRLNRMLFYALFAAVPFAAAIVILYLYEVDFGPLDVAIGAGVLLVMTGALALKDFSSDHAIGEDTRFDPVALFLARLFGAKPPN